ncbi:(2Fe-2S)-binding protein [Xanthomonas sp. XNM01]|uniref:(2Fe-2S)-binding protein n=1 Tax=Xanthomonas sp. XNM01 TaxID=2769289 RepID=UPI00178422AC|nr:(2Fe-2S)-binding protein [Xanthomonas sp. XNM01]
MYVCICNGVTDRQIREAVENGCSSVSELTMRTGCGATCGSCLDMAAGMIDDMRAALPLPVLAAAA